MKDLRKANTNNAAPDTRAFVFLVSVRGSRILLRPRISKRLIDKEQSDDKGKKERCDWGGTKRESTTLKTHGTFGGILSVGLILTLQLLLGIRLNYWSTTSISPECGSVKTFATATSVNVWFWLDATCNQLDLKGDKFVAELSPSRQRKARWVAWSTGLYWRVFFFSRQSTPHGGEYQTLLSQNRMKISGFLIGSGAWKRNLALVIFKPVV